MATTKIQIWNRALGAVGARTVASETENTPEAIQCKLYWDAARRGALREYPWAFARTRSRLASTPLPDVYAGDWGQAYAAPDGCLKVLRVFSQGDRLGRPPFALVRGTGGNVMILTDVPQALADCVTDVTEVSCWDELFCRVMALKLAASLVAPLLKGNAQKLAELEELCRQALPGAQAADASEGKWRNSIDTWLAQRAGGRHDA